MPIKTLAKLLSSILLGVTCSLLVPLSIYIIDLLVKIFYPQPWEAWGYVTLLLLIACIMPVSVICSGLFSLAAASKLGLSGWDYLILSELSGIASTISGLTLAGFSMDALGLILNIALYAQCALIGVLLYLLFSRVLARTKVPTI